MRELVCDYVEYLISQIRQINKKDFITALDAVKKDVLQDVVDELTELIYK